MARRTYRFAMRVEVEPDHVAYDDPEWAADAAAFSLSGYGLSAWYSELEQLEVSGPGGERTQQFLVTFDVDDDHVAFDDPEWAADAAHGALTNEFGLAAIYTEAGFVTGS